MQHQWSGDLVGCVGARRCDTEPARTLRRRSVLRVLLMTRQRRHQLGTDADAAAVLDVLARIEHQAEPDPIDPYDIEGSTGTN